jgi:hypothetical protein
MGTQITLEDLERMAEKMPNIYGPDIFIGNIETKRNPKKKKYIWNKDKGELEEVPGEEMSLIKLEKANEADLVFQRYLEAIKRDILRRWRV